MSTAITKPRVLPDTKAAFLSLIRLGIGHDVTDALIVPDWSALQALATRQGLAAVLMDGIEQLPLELCPPKVLLLQWIGEVLQNYEQRYNQYQHAIAEMAGFFNEHHYKMMIRICLLFRLA